MRIRNYVYFFISFLILDIIKSFCLVIFFLVGVCFFSDYVFIAHKKQMKQSLMEFQTHRIHDSSQKDTTRN